MRKGVSPVVATVLLIAIAVISAVAVWYWFSPLVSGQSTPGTAQYSLTIQHVYYNSTNEACIAIDVSNNGGTAIPANMVFSLVWSNFTSTGMYVNSSGGIGSNAMLRLNITLNGNASPQNITGIPKGQVYILRANVAKSLSSIVGYVDYRFSC